MISQITCATAKKYACQPPNMKFCFPQKDISFCGEVDAGIELKRMQRTYDIPTCSLLFRRNENRLFVAIANAIKKVCYQNSKPSMLIVGVGNGEEPISYLTTIKTLFPTKPLYDVVDLNCVDILSKVDESELIEHAKLPSGSPLPTYAKKGFHLVTDPISHSRKFLPQPEILNFLGKVFDQSTQWETKIESFAAKAADDSYHLISMNNVLCYIESADVRKKLMEDITRILKPNGILITDPVDKDYKSFFKCLENFINIAPGIWKKVH